MLYWRTSLLHRDIQPTHLLPYLQWFSAPDKWLVLSSSSKQKNTTRLTSLIYHPPHLIKFSFVGNWSIRILQARTRAFVGASHSHTFLPVVSISHVFPLFVSPQDFTVNILLASITQIHLSALSFCNEILVTPPSSLQYNLPNPQQGFPSNPSFMFTFHWSSYHIVVPCQAFFHMLHIALETMFWMVWGHTNYPKILTCPHC